MSHKSQKKRQVGWPAGLIMSACPEDLDLKPRTAGTHLTAASLNASVAYAAVSSVQQVTPPLSHDNETRAFSNDRVAPLPSQSPATAHFNEANDGCGCRGTPPAKMPWSMNFRCPCEPLQAPARPSSEAMPSTCTTRFYGSRYGLPPGVNSAVLRQHEEVIVGLSAGPSRGTGTGLLCKVCGDPVVPQSRYRP